jgi:SulP family sulfate permease
VALGRSDLLDELGDEHVFGNIDDALNHARAHLGLAVVPRPAFAAPTVARETPVDGVSAVRRDRPANGEE